MNYYNEINPKAAAALRQLMADGLIPRGDVDERSICDVQSSELRGYTQCHFFAGIGGWSLALELAGWPASRSVWTGSCPCQPFSTAGKGLAQKDERHLWPVWFQLIRESKPSIVFGEQVPAAIRHGWWDDVADDLEGIGYATRAQVRPACSVGAPHKRERLWFVGYTKHDGRHGAEVGRSDDEAISNGACGQNGAGQFTRAGQSVDVVDSACQRSCGTFGAGCKEAGRQAIGNGVQFGRTGFQCVDVANTSGGQCGGACEGETEQPRGTEIISPSDVANAASVFAQGREDRSGQVEPWGSCAWIQCPDGKQRLIEPSICLLANGVPERVATISAAGNAIVPAVAAAFIKENDPCSQ
jgi:DNA (cytosine-5)-methyltransferase 1